MTMKTIRDHAGQLWDVDSSGIATARGGPVILKNAPPRCYLVQERQTESRPMRESGGQRYQATSRGTRSSSGTLPPEVTTGGIRTVSSGGARRKTTTARSEKEHGDE
jgi:hypothetical protein